MGNRSDFCNLGFARLDTDRKKRRGFSEVIYCRGKTREQLKKIVEVLLKKKEDVLLTKLDKAVFAYLKKTIPSLQYNPLAQLGHCGCVPVPRKRGLVTVISAGTADIPVAEEAAATLEIMGNRIERLYDVGVAGVHRLMNSIDRVRKSNVVVVVAGMEGALASLVSGLISCPVIAVPTSCGYGASFNGLAALLTMLNSCSPGVTVVNIDNGFGAGYFASLINRD